MPWGRIQEGLNGAIFLSGGKRDQITTEACTFDSLVLLEHLFAALQVDDDDDDDDLGNNLCHDVNTALIPDRLLQRNQPRVYRFSVSIVEG